MKEKACVAGSRPEERSAMPEKEAKETKNIVTNSHPRDSSGKLIFEDATLCAQFCRDYVDFIETCREFGLSREEMLGRLAKKYEISLQLAEEWYEKAVGMSG